MACLEVVQWDLNHVRREGPPGRVDQPDGHQAGWERGSASDAPQSPWIQETQGQVPALQLLSM